MEIEVIAFGAILAAGALFVGLPLGVAVGYAWRDRISRARRGLFQQERRRAELNVAAIPRSSIPALVAAEETSIPHATARRTRKKATQSKDSVANDIGKDRKRKPAKSKLKVVTSGVLQEPSSDPHTQGVTMVRL